MNEKGSRYGWTRQYPENLFDATDAQNHNNKTLNENTKKEETMHKTSTDTIENKRIPKKRLDCGKPVNYTKYDHLIGIAQRHSFHPVIPEPKVNIKI